MSCRNGGDTKRLKKPQQQPDEKEVPFFLEKRENKKKISRQEKNVQSSKQLD